MGVQAAPMIPEMRMHTFTEEILLLLGDEDGAFLPIRQHAFECALAGAVLMDLAFANRIDTDLAALRVTDPAPTGNPMLDRVLAKIGERSGTTDAPTWIRLLSTEDAATIREEALASLVERGSLARREERFLWAFSSVRYPTVDDRAVRGIKARIERALLEDIPDPRDIALISLADACQILPSLIHDRAVEEDLAPRIERLRRMDLIGREVASTISDIQQTIVRATRAQGRRFQTRLLTFSATGVAAIAATVFAPRVPVPDRFPAAVLDDLWFGGFWQHWTGYLLLALSLAGLVAAVIVRKRLATRMVGSHRWRLAHVVVGVSCVLTLFAHTGFRFGSNINAALMGTYLTALVAGALAGVVIGGTPRLQRIGAANAGRLRRSLLRIHALAICPLPALLAVHVLLAYLY